MTLIITEITELGIIMAGDTAYSVESRTTQGTFDERAFKGLVKVLPIDKINAGLSYWGWATMPPGNPNQGVWMDWWIRDFLTRNQEQYETIDELAILLETELRTLIPPLSSGEHKISPLGNGGIHLAGYVDHEGNPCPCLWHIHNGISQQLPEKEINPLIVNANNDYPPERYVREGSFIIRTGDFEPYARFFEGYLLDYGAELLEEESILVPLPNLLSRAEFIRAQIRFISEIYSVSGDITIEGDLQRKIRSISDEVTLLLISENEIQGYFTR